MALYGGRDGHSREKSSLASLDTWDNTLNLSFSTTSCLFNQETITLFRECWEKWHRVINPDDFLVPLKVVLAKIRRLINFNCRIPRNKNGKADILSKLASSNSIELYLDVWIKILEKLSIEEGLVANPINTENNWRTPFKDYLLTRSFSWTEMRSFV